MADETLVTEEPTVVEEEPTSLLSDQSSVIQAGMDQTQTIADDTIGQLQGVEAPEVEYTPVDSVQLQEDAAIQPGASYVTPEATVSGQLQSLLDSESDYMKQAQRRSDEKAAQLGLLGSSMAVGAGERAAREAALPVAQADAKTYATAQLQEQQVYNAISTKKAESDLSAAAREHIYDIDAAKMEVQGTYNQIMENAKLQGNLALETTLTEVKSNWDAEVRTSLTNLEGDLNARLKAQEISANERQYASTSSSQIMASAYGTINDLMGNPDFMAGYADNPEALTGVFNNFINLAKNQVEFIGATAGLGDEYFGDAGYGSLIGSWETSMSGYTPPA